MSSEHEQLTILCQRLGATGAQAEVMARQLAKRADQLAQTRGVSRVQAMAYLLDVLVKGRAGEGPESTPTRRAEEGGGDVPERSAADARAEVDNAVSPSLDSELPMKEQLLTRFREVYGRAPEFLAQAPGRIEFIGNHTDYNGGTVLGASIDRGVWVALASRQDGQRRFFSDFAPEIVSVDADAPKRQSGQASWLNYPLGVIAALPEFGQRAPGGFDYLAASNLPPGAGLSSSAAIELASGLAFLAATKQGPSRETLVKIGKHAENHFVGVPCGILDQGVSGFGKKDHLVFIDCRGPRFATVPLPAGAHFWIFNTHTKHALVDGMYAARHRECMEAAKALGVNLLVESDLAALEAKRSALSDVAYKRAKHVMEEIARVEQTQEALRIGDLKRVGQLLVASHRSSQHQFENSTEELDTLVDTLVGTPEVYGARLTGGGFGGAVMALTSGKFSHAEAEKVSQAYAAKYGSKPDIIHCQTGPGATLL